MATLNPIPGNGIEECHEDSQCSLSEVEMVGNMPCSSSKTVKLKKSYGDGVSVPGAPYNKEEETS